MTGVRIAGALGWFWFSGVPWEEARALLTATLAAADAEGVADAVRPLADRVALGTFLYPHTGQHYFASDTEAMLSLTARELALWDTVVADAARPAALTAAQRLALARGRSLAHQLRALALAMSGNADAAVPEMTRSVAVADAGGDAWLAAVMTTRRALVHLLCGDAAAADAAYRAAIPLLRALGEWWFLSLTYEGMAAGALLAGDVAGGVRDARLGVRVLRADRDEWFASRSLDTLAALLATDGARRAAGADDTQAVTAVRLLGAADGLRRRCGALPFGPDRARQEGVVRRLRAWLGDGAYATAHAAGAAMSLDEVFAFVDDDAPFAALGAAGSADGADVSRVPSEGAVRETHADGRPAAVARTLHVSLLGSFALRAGDAPLPREVVPVGKARELLLWLLLHAQGTKEEIALALWPDASAAQVRNTFHVTLHHLRRQLGDPHWITHERGVYRMLRRGDDGRRLEVDVDAVLAAAARLRAAARARTNAAVATAGADGEDPSAAAHALDAAALDDLGAALERWHGDLAGDSATGDWIAAHRARVHEAWADGMEALATLLAARGRHEDARDACERLLRREPLRESVHRQLMTTLAALGKRADALAHYAALVDQLRRDLGVPPSAQTQALAKQLAATS
jgi:DNA-binding SARP family transcriptional activator